MTRLNRRTFVATSVAAAGAGAALSPAHARTLRWIDGGLHDAFPAHDPGMVQEIVGKSHFDFDTVKRLVTDRPTLAKVAWDWGFGDWESALGAASHMGRRDMAELLIAHGARPNLFTFAMFGQIDAVRSVCEANPGIQKIPGPHGITLMQHAKQGGDEAASVVAYLEELGGADERPDDLPLDEKTAAQYVGTYEPEGMPGTVFHLKRHDRRKILTFARDDRQLRFLLHRGNHVFQPGGAPTVQIRFTLEDSHASSLEIIEGSMSVKAKRM